MKLITDLITNTISAAIATIVMKSTEVQILRTALNLPVACQIALEVSVVKKTGSRVATLGPAISK